MKHITNNNLQRLHKALLPYLSLQKRKDLVKSIAEVHLRNLIKNCNSQNKDTVALYLAFRGLFRNCDALLWQDRKGAWCLFRKSSLSYKRIKALKHYVGL